MIPSCTLSRKICCKTCGNYSVCYKSCMFQLVTCETCTYKINKQEKRKMKNIRIKYFDGAIKMNKIAKGDWIDVYANKDVFVPFMAQAMIPLGFAMELPKGMEGHLAPRGSTMKSWGVIQTNSVGVVDETFKGDNDQWHLPVQCTMAHECINTQIEGHKVRVSGVWIRKGDKIGQFRIINNMEEIEFEEVLMLENEDRGMEGSTGTIKLEEEK